MRLLILTVALMTIHQDSQSNSAGFLRNSQILNVLRQLHELSESPPTNSHLRLEVVKRLSSVSASEDLRRVALLARYMASGRAEDEKVDAIYWDAFWSCAEKLADRTDAESVLQLSMLAEESRLGGGDLVFMKKLLHDQEHSERMKKDR
jgi:hypothetical protein